MGATQRNKDARDVSDDTPVPMPRQKKPDYVGALMGVVCCACAFFLLFGQRSKPLTFAEQVSGEWNLKAVRLLPTEQLGKQETLNDWNLLIDTSGLGAGKARGTLKKEEMVRGLTIETGTKFGRVTFQGENEMIGYEFDFRHLTNAQGPKVSSRQSLAGVYRFDEKVVGRVEGSVEGGSMFVTFVPDDAAEAGLQVVGSREVAGKERPEYVDNLIVGVLVFVMVVIVSFIRAALKPQ